MSLIKLCRERIIQDVFRHGHSTKHWRVLIIDEQSARILTKLFKNSEVLSFEILIIQKLNDTERNSFPDNPALYLVDLNEISTKIILKDHDNKKYSRFTVIAVNDIQENIAKKFEKSKNSDILIKSTSQNFICHDDHSFTCSLDNIHHVSDILKIRFSTYCFQNHQKQKFSAVDSKLQKVSGNIRLGDMIFYDRINDISTPLIRFYTFQALLQDFRIIKDGILEDGKMDLENSELWSKIKDVHIAEVNNILSHEAAKINSQVNQIQDADTKNLVSLVLQAPEQMQLKEEVSTFLNLLDRCFELFEKHQLKSYGILQQNIAVKKTETGASYSSAISDCHEAFGREQYTLEDKYRLWLLVQCNGYDFSDFETKELIKCGIITKSDKSLSKKIQKNRNQNFSMKQPESQYPISRFRPLLFHCLYNFLNSKKGIEFIKITTHLSEIVPSLRKTTFIFKKTDSPMNRRTIVIYIDGGMTVAEMTEIRDFHSKFGVDCYIGSNEILDTEAYTKYLGTLPT